MNGNFQRHVPVNGKPIHYRCYGNSRDAYIAANSGGFIPERKSDSKMTFYANLRSYEAPAMTRSPSNRSLRSLSPSGSAADLALSSKNKDFLVDTQF